jgi:hypothetical protein
MTAPARPLAPATHPRGPESAPPVDDRASDAPSPTRLLRAALRTIVAASSAPYGYTISVWSSGAVLINGHGVPHVAEVFAFLAGALTAFGLMAIAANGALTRMELLDHAPNRVLAGTLHWAAAGGAVGAAALLAQIHSWAAWPLGSFAATAIYILGASAQLAAVSVRRARTQRL